MKNDFEGMTDQIEQPDDGKKKKSIAREIMELREELGEDAPMEEVEEAIEEILYRRLSEVAEEEEKSADAVLNEEERAYMEETTGVVRDFLNANEWNFNERVIGPGIRSFEMGLVMKNVQLRIRIHIELDPKVCRIVALLPINADPTYEYLLCKAMATENYNRRFGGFKYDERDGEMTYEHTFLALHGIAADELGIYFNAVISSACGGYDAVRKGCTGRLKRKEVDEVLEKINILVNDISDDE